MGSSRSRCLVVNPSPDKIIIVGGIDLWNLHSHVEECAVSNCV